MTAVTIRQSGGANIVSIPKAIVKTGLVAKKT